MRFSIALRIASTMLFAAGASVASAQLSSRSANGGLFNSLVDWNPVVEQGLLGVGEARMTPWAASRVQLGTVRAADPNRPWMGYWGHTEDRELANVVGAEHSLRANPIAYANSANRGHSMSVPDLMLPDVAANSANSALNNPNGQGLDADGLPAFPPIGNGDVLAATAGEPNVIVNPDPESYALAAVGLVLIALIRKYRLA